MQGLHDWYAENAAEDMVVINVVALDNTGGPAAVDVATTWETDLGLTWVTVADPDGSWVETWGGNGGTNHHSYVVVDHEGKVTWKNRSGSTVFAMDIYNALEDAPSAAP